MSRYRKISTRIWNDANFASLSDDGKLLFLFLLTHPNMTPMGAMRATLEGLASELNWSLERLSEGFRKASLKGMVEFDSTAKCVGIPNFLKHNLPESPNVITAWEKTLDDIPECQIKALCYQRAGEVVKGMSEPFQKAFRRVAQAFAKPMPYQEQEQEQEQEVKSLAEDADSSGVAPALFVAQKPWIEFPTNRPGELFPVFDSQIAQWRSLYPAVNVQQELRNMYGWLESRPRERKTKSGLPRFVQTWLKRAQDAPAKANGFNTAAPQLKFAKPEARAH